MPSVHRAAAGIAVSLAVLAAQQPESFVTYDEANEPVPIAYGQACSTFIDTATDIDRFKFCGHAGETVWITVQATFNPMDPVIDVYDSAYALVMGASSACSDYCSLRQEFTLPADDTYTVTVFDSGLNESGQFVLGLERVPPPLNARRLGYNVQVPDNMHGGVDVDWFTMFAVAGPPLRLNVNATSNPMDPVVRILDATGMVIASNFCNDYCSFLIDWTAPYTGVYFVQVYENGANESGPYELSLNTLVGTAPSTLASAFEDVGLANGIAGACGVPLLTGDGLLAPGTSNAMHMRHFPANQFVVMAAGFTRVDLLLFGGTLVPAPEIVLAGVADTLGSTTIPIGTVPAGFPAGVTLFTQAFTLDPAAAFGIAASNPVVGVVP